jgi:AcrR family transcriptional regulator
MPPARPPQRTPEHRRADAERSIAAILDAAVEVLSERPDASVEDIAGAAGVSRQTVYAHYPSRRALLEAVQERALADAVAAIDAARPESGPPAEALDRLVTAGWETLGRHARLIDAFLVLRTADDLHALHRPIFERDEELIARGQRGGEFDRELSTGWLSAAAMALFHAAAQEVGAGRMSRDEAEAALKRTLRRVYGAPG